PALRLRAGAPAAGKRGDVERGAPWSGGERLRDAGSRVVRRADEARAAVPDRRGEGSADADPGGVGPRSGARYGQVPGAAARDDAAPGGARRGDRAPAVGRERADRTARGVIQRFRRGRSRNRRSCRCGERRFALGSRAMVPRPTTSTVGPADWTKLSGPQALRPASSRGERGLEPRLQNESARGKRGKEDRRVAVRIEAPDVSASQSG